MIGIYDSGLGGLSAFRELRRLCPRADTVYLADTAHLPYGSKSKRELTCYASAAFSFLARMGADYIIVACGTVSTAVLPHIKRSPVPVYGVALPAAKKAAELSAGRIAVLATEAAISSGGYTRLLHRYSRACTMAVSCPLWVPMLESGLTDCSLPVVRAAAEHYLLPVREFSPDTVILGCTHFPFLTQAITEVLPDAAPVDAGAEGVRAALRDNPTPKGRGRAVFYTTGSPSAFAIGAGRLLGYIPGTVCRVSAEMMTGT